MSKPTKAQMNALKMVQMFGPLEAWKIMSSCRSKTYSMLFSNNWVRRLHKYTDPKSDEIELTEEGNAVVTGISHARVPCAHARKAASLIGSYCVPRFDLDAEWDTAVDDKWIAEAVQKAIEAATKEQDELIARMIRKQSHGCYDALCSLCDGETQC